MEHTIIELHQDDEQEWVGVLSCGHTRHFRHNPPWQESVWVLTEEGRAGFVGTKVECVQCEERQRP